MKKIYELWTDTRGYVLYRIGDGPRARYIAGCRNFTLKQARDHWGSEEYLPRELGAAFVKALRRKGRLRARGMTSAQVPSLRTGTQTPTAP